jgi:hypothetical protein
MTCEKVEVLTRINRLSEIALEFHGELSWRSCRG